MFHKFNMVMYIKDTYFHLSNIRHYKKDKWNLLYDMFYIKLNYMLDKDLLINIFHLHMKYIK